MPPRAVMGIDESAKSRRLTSSRDLWGGQHAGTSHKVRRPATQAGAARRELAGYGCKTQMQVVRLLAPRIENEGRTKDFDFSASGITARRDAGYEATSRALDRVSWRGEFDPIEGVILHEEMTELQAGASDS